MQNRKQLIRQEVRKQTAANANYVYQAGQQMLKPY